MKIELLKKENLDGTGYYHVVVDGSSQKAFQMVPEGLKEATEYFSFLKERLTTGFPKSETILSETI